MTSFYVIFTGLPSSGKSSIINSLIGKRILESGIYRTTIDYNQLDDIIIDDNNNEFRVIDLPGICDSDEKDTKFNDLTYNHITNANLIIWVSDVNKAFTTTYEVTEYNKLKLYINKLSEETGKLYYIAILLSKCDNNTVKKQKKIKKPTDEIEDSDEDTYLINLIEKVNTKFANEDVMLFNAYGRSYYHKNTSNTLKKFVQKMIGIPTKYNINFDITKYIVGYNKIQEELYYNHFVKNYYQYLNTNSIYNVTSFNNLQIYWRKLSSNNCKLFIDSLCQESSSNIETLKKILMSENHVSLYSKINNYFLFLTYIRNNLDSVNDNLIETIDDIIIYYHLYEHIEKNIDLQLFLNSFLAKKISVQIDIFKNLLFDYKFPKCEHILNTIMNNVNYFKIYDFKLIFNDIIKKNRNKIDRFHSKFLLTSNTNQWTYNNVHFNQNKYEIFMDYIEHIKKLNNDHYILYNKIQIMHCIYTKRPINYHLKILINYDIGIPHSRKIMNNSFNTAIKNIYQQIYSNIIIPYDSCDIYNFEPFDIDELMYKISNDNVKFNNAFDDDDNNDKANK